MTPILLTIALAGLLHITQFVVASYMANVDMGPGYTTSPRDHDSTRPVRTTTGRMLRAYDNNVQMFPFFASGVLLIHLTDQATGVTVGAAWVYITARALYIPAYALGWQPWRSYIWLVAMAAVATLFIASLI
ncbi:MULTISPECIES: MAPEG family protein [Roseobacteraceae]|uniref:MAPEG family protein n=1 Tax=Pseudosulfitobacter pseudonitzschiae TaxID=1402135 RepID=A0A221JX96_9RHOB|nr:MULTISPECIES: MAPEG family protein [Roseobacteraceae]ASM71217.1 MAPEG family protein [Pseudosulfitobacter pseudonitzschiae]